MTLRQERERLRRLVINVLGYPDPGTRSGRRWLRAIDKVARELVRGGR